MSDFDFKDKSARNWGEIKHDCLGRLVAPLGAASQRLRVSNLALQGTLISDHFPFSLAKAAF